MIKKIIIDRIKKNNKAISLQEFINICLFDKKGYYKNSNPIGKSGDFITSPEISQLFGEIIGIYIYYFWKTKINKNINLIELGPGNGTLFMDILRITSKLKDFHNNIEIHLIEKNSRLKQKQKINFYNNKFNKININWHESLSQFNKKPAIIFANEFFDCFPIRQFKKTNNIWEEKYIKYDEKNNRFSYEYISIRDKKLNNFLEINQNNELVEVSEERIDYFKRVCEYVHKVSGMIIIIDYGYLKFPGYFTLQSINNHRNSNPLDNIGNQDITSLVNFSEFIKIALNTNLKIENYCTQKEFLIANGINERKNKLLENLDKNQKKEFELGFERLINEKNMGSIFKFLIISKDTNNDNF